MNPAGSPSDRPIALVVGKNRDLLMSLCGALELLGLQTCVATNGKQAVALQLEHDARLVTAFLEVDRTEGKHREILATLRAFHPEMPCYLIGDEGETSADGGASWCCPVEVCCRNLSRANPAAGECRAAESRPDLAGVGFPG